MTQEEKDLLFKDLCARLPYHPKFQLYYKLFKLLIRFVHSIVLYEINNRKYIIEYRNL